MPGYVGLSVVHSFAFGCPVITCKGDIINGPFHSPEFEYVIDNYNGLISEDSPQLLSDRLISVLEDTKRHKLLSENALRTAYEAASIDKMINGFYQAISYV